MAYFQMASGLGSSGGGAGVVSSNVGCIVLLAVGLLVVYWGLRLLRGSR